MIPTLKQLYDEHTGKVSDKWSSYLDTYDDIFFEYRQKRISLLEIGIQNGGSLEIWAKYFSKSQLLVGCDIDEKCRNLQYEDERIRVVVGDATTQATEAEILKNSATFDLILDDGSHRSGDIVATFARYFRHLTEGGMYVAEDLHCSYWRDFQGGLFDLHSSVSFFKLLADLVNFDHWGIQGARTDLLKTFSDEYECQFSESDLDTIHSIEFRNSMCVIKKKRRELNSLGHRLVAGAEASVFPFILTLKGTDLLETYKSNEEQNERSNLHKPPYIEISSLRDENERLKVEADARTRQLDEQTNYASKVSQAFNRVSRESTHQISRLRAEVETQQTKIAFLEDQVRALHTSASWRVTAPLRNLSTLARVQKRRLSTILRATNPGGKEERASTVAAASNRLPSRSTPAISDQYEEWIARFDTLDQGAIELIQKHIIEVPPPKVLLIWIWPAGKAEFLQEAVESIEKQICPNWRAIFVTQDEAASSIGLSRSNAQILFKQKLSEAELSGESAEHILIIDRPGVLAPHCTYMAGVAARQERAAVFCDEDTATAHGRRSPRFAPPYAPGFGRIGSMALLPASPALINALVDESRAPLNLSTLCEKLIGESALPVRHLPFVLFHNRQSPEDSKPCTSGYLQDDTLCPSINIIIPTRDGLEYLLPCIDSILRLTDYPREKFRITVVDNGSTDPAVLRFLNEKLAASEIAVIRDPRKFNYSRLNNGAASESREELLAFVNNDIVVLDAKWLRRLAYYAIKPTAGAIGAKLLYPDHTVQHGGVILGIQGVAAHAHHNLPATAPGYMGLSSSTHPISAVTGACLVVRRSVFEEIGGFDEALEVAFNDVLLCIEIMRHGYENVYIGDPLLVHFESKTRGFDDTAEKKKIFRSEARYARRHSPQFFQNDPYYNSNLSLEQPYEIAFPPRRELPWNRHRRESTGRLRILLLSITHQIGHGVAVVLDLQARHLVSEGHEVFIGGPTANAEFAYSGCQRIHLDDPKEAAIFAVENDIDCVVMHTPPFYSTCRWLSGAIKTLAYDYGEPNPQLFSDSEARQEQLNEKDFCLEMADALYAISASVKAESNHERMEIIPLGNSHLATWSELSAARREKKRQELGLSDAIVVLNVCRFHKAERNYKGIDDYANVHHTLDILYPEEAKDFIFVLAGKGNDSDVLEMEACGLRVFSNVTDDELVDLYCCADIYANFSKWEGYNLGIGQAQAMGLPIIASDIPAHRAFGEFVSNDPIAIVDRLVALSQNRSVTRVPKVSGWGAPLEMFSAAIRKLNQASSADKIPSQ
jgi:GT2 family glycosyltransferase